MLTSDLPHLTADVPAIAGAIKRDYADFVVEEIPAYEPCGRGDHVFFTIEKTGLPTMRAVADVAKALNIRPWQIGVAGLKDARAVARQTLSVEHVDPAAIERLSIPRIRVLSLRRHTNKLKIGHLRGNRFVIKLRDVDAGRLGDVRRLFDVLGRRGVPNYFGAQRFGLRGDTWQIGEALIRNDAKTAVDLMCGRAGPDDYGDVLAARRLYDEGRYEEASRTWPYLFRPSARACRILAQSNGNFRRALGSVDKNLKQFFISAFQSQLFNRVLAARIAKIDELMIGDLAWKHDNGSVFSVTDAAAEQPRAERFEVSATGPLFGHRMTEPTADPARLESDVLASTGLTREDFGRLGGLSPHGGRRPLRFQPRDTVVQAARDDAGEYFELCFALPAGCYATAVLREICKAEMAEGREEES